MRSANRIDSITREILKCSRESDDTVTVKRPRWSRVYWSALITQISADPCESHAFSPHSGRSSAVLFLGALLSGFKMETRGGHFSLISLSRIFCVSRIYEPSRKNLLREINLSYVSLSFHTINIFKKYLYINRVHALLFCVRSCRNTGNYVIKNTRYNIYNKYLQRDN